MTERFIMFHHEVLGMSLTPIVSKVLHELISGPYLLGLVLFILGLVGVKPLMVMSGSVILIGMAAISMKYGD